EDGIRDLIVTGVQTCALPISDALRHRRSPKLLVAANGGRLGSDGARKMRVPPASADEESCAAPCDGDTDAARVFTRTGCLGLERSEERRVGKEGRSRWSMDD